MEHYFVYFAPYLNSYLFHWTERKHCWLSLKLRFVLLMTILISLSVYNFTLPTVFLCLLYPFQRAEGYLASFGFEEL